MTTSFRRAAAGLVFWGAVLVPLACAHDPLQAWATATVRPEGIDIELVLSAYPAQTLIDKDLKRPAMSPENFDTYQPDLQQAALGLFEITDGGRPLKVQGATVELTEEADIEFRISYPAPTTGPLHFRITYLDRILEGFITTLFVEDKAGQSLAWDELSTEKDWLDAPLTPAPGPATAASPAAPLAPPVAAAPSPVPAISRPVMPAGKFVGRGALAMIADFGHLLFLVGLLVVCRNFRSAIALTACFMLGHSLTLALATLARGGLSSRLVTILIAASIVFVAVENLVRRAEPRGRWLAAFVFGLVHGLGFANALKQILPEAGRRPPVGPLLSYNLGIELGVIAVAAIFLALWWKLRRLPSFARFGPPVVSSVVAVLGVCWLLQQTILS